MNGSENKNVDLELKQAVKPYRNSIAYVFSAIVILLVLVFILDYIWLKLSPEPLASPEWPELIFELLEEKIESDEPISVKEFHIDGQTISLRIEPLSDVYLNNLGSLELSEAFLIEKDEGAYYLKLLPEQSLKLSLGPFSQSAERHILSSIGPVIFYFLLAIILWLWLYPVLSGLGRLSYAIKNYKIDRSWPLELKTRSKAVQILIISFNELTARIQSLISTQSDLTQGLSHELRTPLARAKFALASLRTHSKCDEELLGSIATDIEEMEFLTNSILEYSRIQALDEIRIDDELGLVVLIESVCSSYQWKTRIPIEVQAVDTSDEKLLVNSALFRIAVSNLLANAIKYAKTKIVIEFTEEDTLRRLTVLDDGCGIAEEYYETLLRPFERLHNTSSNHVGFGLGLAVVNRIMVLHKGSLLLGRSKYGGLSASLEW